MMSTSNLRLPRTTRDKSQKANPESTKVADGNPLKVQPTAEQIRLAQMINDTKDTDDPGLQDKIRQVMELTGKSSDEASVALHDCDNDPNRAIDMLLEGEADQGEWETSIKRKKTRPNTTQVNAEASTSVSMNNKENRNRSERVKEREGKEREINRTRGPPRMNRGRGRDIEKNKRNLEDSRSRERSSDGRGRGSRIINGPSRGGRGRGGGRIRTFQSRGSHSDFPRSIDTWTNSPTKNTESNDQPMRVGNWSDDGFPAAEDWDNEDWTGSLAETKVFTPSANIINSNFKHQHSLDATLQQSSILLPPEAISLSTTLTSVRQLGTSQGTMGGFAQSNLSTVDLIAAPSVISSNEPVDQSSTFSFLSNPPSATDKTPSSSGSILGVSTVASMQIPAKALNVQPSTISTTPTTTNSHQQVLAPPPPPSRSKQQRGRLPTTSKIPASAVEMPDDAIAALDVQFGSLEFGSESSTINFSNASSLQPPAISAVIMANHISSVNNSAPSSSSALSLHLNTSSKTMADLSSSDSTSRTGYPLNLSMANKDLGQVLPTSQQNVSQLSNSDVVSFVNQSGERKNSTPSFPVQRATQSAVDISPISGSKSTESNANSTFNVSNSASNSHSNFQSTYGGHKPTSSYSRHSSTLATTPTQSTVASLYGQSSSQNPPLVTFSPVNPSASAYATSQASQNSYSGQHVYANPGGTVSTYASTSSISQTGYGSQGHSSLHTTLANNSKISNVGNVKDHLESSSSQLTYDTTNTSTLTTASGSSLGLSGGVLANSNVLTAKPAVSTSNGKAGVLPPGVPIVQSHQYIMSQAGMPFYSLQQPMYTYEDLQLLQQRMPPMASYYDMSFQPSSNTLTGRDTGLPNVAYAGADGKYSRADNSSPVPTTLSQQQQQTSTQQHQQAFISPTALPHGYGYYYPGGVVASGFTQYGAPIFPVPPASNAHGATTNSHFQKQNAYSSSHGYTSGYDGLGQTQDYGKNAYCSSSQNQKGMSAGSSGSGSSVGGTDMSGSVYNKAHSHSQMMNKQSYDKPGFHAGTPPPFNLGTQTAQMGAPSTYAPAPFISMMAQHPSPMMHLHQDSSNTSQRPTSTQNKVTSSAKQAYGAASYWAST